MIPAVTGTTFGRGVKTYGCSSRFPIRSRPLLHNLGTQMKPSRPLHGSRGHAVYRACAMPRPLPLSPHAEIPTQSPHGPAGSHARSGMCPSPRSSSLFRRSQQQGLHMGVRCPATDSAQGGESKVKERFEPWQLVAAISAVAMMLCNFNRSNFTMLLPAMSNDLGFTLSQMGGLQSATLFGYMVGQLPSGYLSDRFGGERVLLAGLVLWSMSMGVMSLVGSTPQPSLAVLISRLLFGLTSAVAIPAVSAMAAKWVPPETKASTLASIYALFNIGGVLGLVLTPYVANMLGWAPSFLAVSGVGFVWAAFGWMALNYVTKGSTGRSVDAGSSTTEQATSIASSSSSSGDATSPSKSSLQEAEEEKQAGTALATKQRLHVIILCWAHAVIGWGFFVMQSWLPMYMKSLGVASLADAGALSGLPWTAAAIVGAWAGRAADGLITEKGIERLRVRRGMHAVSTIGCGLSILPLVVASSHMTPALATFFIVLFASCNSFSFGGFHAYIQDVAESQAGITLGLTNSCSIAMGILGNLGTGYIVEATGSYASIFLIAVLLYLSSCAIFLTAMDGTKLYGK
eukprot:gene12598-15824_t